jgi:pimeloyl-ACP methyl ester carboxylesterase
MPDSRPHVLLVHGAFADATCWQHLVPLLERDGFEVSAVQNPLTALADDVATTRRALDALHGPVIVVGHSYGGVVITEAAAGRADVAALVYVAAFVPDAGDTVGGLLERFPGSALPPALVPDTAGFVTIYRARYREAFAGDVPEAAARVMAVTQNPVAHGVLGQTVTRVAWRERPSWYVVATEDRAIPPELQRFLALRSGAHTAEVRSSHVPHVSRPEEVARVVRAAAGATVR